MAGTQAKAAAGTVSFGIELEAANDPYETIASGTGLDERAMKPSENDEMCRYYAALELNAAARLLSEPDRFERLPIWVPWRSKKIPSNPFDAPRSYELMKAMLELEEIAREVGVRSGFWRFMQRPAQLLGVHGKIDEYESEFHKALARKRE